MKHRSILCLLLAFLLLLAACGESGSENTEEAAPAGQTAGRYALSEGGEAIVNDVDLSHYCAQIADFISAVIIYLCGFVLFFKTVINGWLKKSEEKKIARARAAAEEANKEGGNA